MGRISKINISEKIQLFAKIIILLKEKNYLLEKDCKNQVKLLIREATERNIRLYHLDTDYMSRKAIEQLKKIKPKLRSERIFHQYCSKYFSHDHMVPCERIYKMIIKRENLTQDWLIRILTNFSKRATITKDDNKKLMPYKMPKGFYDKTSEIYLKHQARYKIAGIDGELVKRNENRSWYEEYKNNFADYK
jgi:hypothetical protein